MKNTDLSNSYIFIVGVGCCVPIDDHLAELIEFFEWLKQKYPNLIITGNIPSEKLKEIIYLLRDQEKQIQALSKWKEWYNNIGEIAQKDIGEIAQKALSVSADIVSLALPLLKLLGLPVP